MASLFYVMLVLGIRGTSPFIVDPGLPQKRYVREGDLNIAGIFPISTYDTKHLCGDSLRSTLILQYIEAMVFAVDEVNSDPTILPNITLGFVILDDCLKESTIVAQAISLLRRTGNSTQCEANNQNGGIPTYDVVGVVGSMKSATSIALANLLGGMKMPQVSYASTSDELSNMELYPYFMRVVPPDQFQVEALMSIVLFYKWSYISVIYTSGSYGETAFKNIKLIADANGICIAFETKIGQGATIAEHDAIVSRLLEHQNARAVILFTGPANAIEVMAAIERADAARKFIWIGCEAWGLRLHMFGDHLKTALGAFTVKVYATVVPEFDLYFKSLTPKNTGNPWFKEFWEMHFSCVYSSLNDTCANRSLSSANNYKSLSSVGPVIDAVRAFALGIQSIIETNCSGVFPPNIGDCIDGPAMLAAMRNATFTGSGGLVKFNENGDVPGKYMIQQVVTCENGHMQHEVAVWDGITKSLAVNEDQVTWRYVTESPGQRFPESVCSKPCGPKQFRIQRELPCCWDCKLCRENEILINNSTRCQACPMLQWPDEHTGYLKCRNIEPTAMSWRDPASIVALLFSGVGLFVTSVVCIFYVRHWKDRVIKASSKELSCLILVGVYIGYITAGVLVISPTDATCMANYIGFCLCFTWIYAPLLTKIIRIHRIFESGRKSKSTPRFVSSKAQLVIASSIISVQAILIVASVIVAEPGARLSMPVTVEKYVEKYCDIMIEGMSIFLTYNMIIVILCSIFAFKTRKLPDNFNESKFIAMCVYTTLFIWVAFIATYYTTTQNYYKSLLLSMSLILNDTVILSMLFVPRVYAAGFSRRVGDACAPGVGSSSTNPTNESSRMRSRHVISVAPTTSTTGIGERLK